MYSCVELSGLICRLQSRLSFSKSVLNTSFHRTWSKPVQNMNASPVLLRFNMPGPFCTAYIIKCIAMQKRRGLGCRGYWPLSPSISVLNTSLCRIWSKTVQNRNPIPVQIRFKMPGPFCMGGPFCTVGSCRTVRVWVFVYNLDCAFKIGLNMSFHRIWSKPVQISMTVRFISI